MASTDKQSRTYRYPGSRNSLSSFLNGFLPGSKINWAAEARDAWQNSAVGACLWVLCDTIGEAPVVVKRTGRDGQAVIQPNHDLTLLLKKPQPWLTGGAAMPSVLLWQATILSLTIDGNAYWRIRRNNYGMIVGLEYIPHFYIEPRWEDDTEFIAYYELRTANGERQRIPVEDIIHFRQGVDPHNTRKGLSRLRMVLREIVTDNEATTYAAVVLKNMGIPGVVVMATKGTGEETPTMGNIARQKLKDLFNGLTRGDKRGQTIVLDDEYKLEFPGFTPEQLVLDKVRNIPEARICAATRVPAMVAGLSVGDGQRTYSNQKEAREMFTESTLVPLWGLLDDTLSVQLLPQLSQDVREFVARDLANVRALQEDQNKLWDRNIKAWSGNLIKRSEARQNVGLTADESLDDVYFADVAGAPTGAEPDGDETDPNADSHADTSGDGSKKPKPKKPSGKSAWEMWKAHVEEKRLAAERGIANA